MRVPMSEDEITRMTAKFYLWELKTKRLLQASLSEDIRLDFSYTDKPSNAKPTPGTTYIISSTFRVAFSFMNKQNKNNIFSLYFEYDPKRKIFSYHFPIRTALIPSLLQSIKPLIEIFLSQIELFITSRKEFRLQYLLHPEGFFETPEETKYIVNLIKSL